MKKSPKEKLLFRFYLVIIFLPCLEIALRIAGYQPYQQIPFSIESTPQFCILPDSHLGFTLRPGAFDVTINEGLGFRTTHARDSLRITTYQQPDSSLPVIFLMGCSYTYGMGVDDSLNFPFLIQKKLPGYRIKNYGVPGYSPVQSYLQLKKSIAHGEIPQVVLINFADFHEERISLTPQYRRELHMGFERSNKALTSLMASGRIPYLRNNPERGFRIDHVGWREMYHNWKWREKLAVVNFLQNLSDRNVSRTIDRRGNTIQICCMIRDLCKVHNIHLVITGLTQTEATRQILHRLEELEIRTADISVDLADTRYNNLPFDAHPNQKAHLHFANKLTELLSVCVHNSLHPIHAHI